MNTAEIRAALAAATIGRLEVVPPATSSTRPADCYDVRDVHHGGYVADSLTFPDAHLIANAPTYIADLLAEVDRLTARAEAAERAVQRVRDLAAHWEWFGSLWSTVARRILRALDGGAS